jgi:hypothetical protein
MTVNINQMVAKTEEIIINVDEGRCSPAAHGNFKKYGTCYSPMDVTILARMYNDQANQQDRIPKSHFRNTKKLYNALRSKIHTCEDQHETCLLHQGFVSKNHELFNSLMQKFRPKMPASWKKNDREWLNTYNIYHVMKQYEEVNKDFEFLGVYPVDFATKTREGSCVIRKMCTFTLGDFINSGKRKFGMVINLDRHDQSGSHWVALYASFTNKNFCMVYYDSAGREPPESVKDFMRDVKKQVDELLYHDFGREFKTYFNEVPYQKKNTECGMFSMVFLITCLENSNKCIHNVKKLLNKHKLFDDKVHKFRRYLYSQPDAHFLKLDAATAYEDF